MSQAVRKLVFLTLGMTFGLEGVWGQQGALDRADQRWLPLPPGESPLQRANAEDWIEQLKSVARAHGSELDGNQETTLNPEQLLEWKEQLQQWSQGLTPSDREAIGRQLPSLVDRMIKDPSLQPQARRILEEFSKTGEFPKASSDSLEGPSLFPSQNRRPIRSSGDTRTQPNELNLQKLQELQGLFNQLKEASKNSSGSLPQERSNQLQEENEATGQKSRRPSTSLQSKDNSAHGPTRNSSPSMQTPNSSANRTPRASTSIPKDSRAISQGIPSLQPSGRPNNDQRKSPPFPSPSQIPPGMVLFDDSADSQTPSIEEKGNSELTVPSEKIAEEIDREGLGPTLSRIVKETVQQERRETATNTTPIARSDSKEPQGWLAAFEKQAKWMVEKIEGVQTQEQGANERRTGEVGSSSSGSMTSQGPQPPRANPSSGKSPIQQKRPQDIQSPNRSRDQRSQERNRGTSSSTSPAKASQPASELQQAVARVWSHVLKAPESASTSNAESPKSGPWQWEFRPSPRTFLGIFILLIGIAAIFLMGRSRLPSENGIEKPLRERFERFLAEGVRTRDDVIRLFHLLVANRAWAIPTWWTHQAAAQKLSVSSPALRTALEIVTPAYEQARYLPPETPMSSEQLAKVEVALQQCLAEKC